MSKYKGRLYRLRFGRPASRGIRRRTGRWLKRRRS